MAVQVDVSQTGIVGSTLLAMFRKLGHPIKTVVSPAVMDAVKDRNIASVPLEWGIPLKGRVGNGQAVFYFLDITQEQITQGFIIQVHLAALCLFAGFCLAFRHVFRSARNILMCAWVLSRVLHTVTSFFVSHLQELDLENMSKDSVAAGRRLCTAYVSICGIIRNM